MKPLSLNRTMLAAALAAAGTVALAPYADARPIAKVEIASNYFAPGKKTVKQGTKVRFTWPEFGFDLHDVRVRKGPAKFKSPLQASGTWTRKFTKKGTYRLYCSQHEEMSMTLVVKR